MSDAPPTLHLFCGKIAAGKSTLAATLASMEGTVLISEDEWLGALYSDQLATPRDYVHCVFKLRTVMGPHVAALLKAGVSVVLDFPANTVETRQWMRDILQETNASHTLYLLDIPDELCLARLRARNAQGNHAFAVTEKQFRQFSSHFVAPLAEEGFNIEIFTATG
ncbi:AAA family ATPase [Roseobacter sp. EG26]|uniref:AAA family ATPase n=1 Tax=Roseobacter sp. EG26 TaxID=3412477 RepID=UPI003CE46350